MFSKISLNLVLVGFCCHGNRQFICRTGCLKYAFESLLCLLLLDMNCCEGVFILCVDTSVSLNISFENWILKT